MKPPSLQRLGGRCIFVSVGATGPTAGSEASRDREIATDRTLVACGRSLFAAGCKIIMRLHPKFSPMLLLLAAEYPPRQLAATSGSSKEPLLPQSLLVLAHRREGDRLGPLHWQAMAASGLVAAPEGRDLPDLRSVIAEHRPFAMFQLGAGDREDEAIFRSTTGGRPVIPLNFDDQRALGSLEPASEEARWVTATYGRLSAIGREWEREHRHESFRKFEESEDASVLRETPYRPIQTTVQLLVRGLTDRGFD